MNQYQCNGENCNTPIKDDYEYYCPSCTSELIKEGKLRPRPKEENQAKAIHGFMFK